MKILTKTRELLKRRGRGCLLIVIGVPLLYYGLYFLLRGPLPEDPLIIAHRGGRTYNPENTMAAFEYAIEIGVDYLEFDVQRTKDGVLVVFHDDTVDRTTDGTGKVGDFSLEQLRALDAGDGEQVPTFEEVINLAKEAGVGLLPEAKSPYLYPGIEEEMVAAVAEADYLEWTVFQSFEVDAIEKLSNANPEARVCPLYRMPWEVDASSLPGDAQYLCPMAEMVLLNPWLIRKAHKEGREVYVWLGLLGNRTMMQIMLSMGVDGIMVDDPVALKDVLGR